MMACVQEYERDVNTRKALASIRKALASNREAGFSATDKQGASSASTQEMMGFVKRGATPENVP